MQLSHQAIAKVQVATKVCEKNIKSEIILEKKTIAF